MLNNVNKSYDVVSWKNITICITCGLQIFVTL